MSSPLEQAGAVHEPSEYAALSMDRHITGLWTQRSPLRDADVPYLYGKFYSASRFDSLIDGVNREITARLTSARRPGTSVYNANNFPAINSFYPYKRIVNGQEVIRLIVDGADSNIYDATASGKITIMTKAGGAGKARFVGVNTALYITDGVENKKWLQPAGWAAQTDLTTTTYDIGTIVIDSNGKLQYLNAIKAGTVSNVQVQANNILLTFSATNFNLTIGQSFKMSALVGASFANGALLFAQNIVPSGGNFIVTAPFIHSPYASTADTGNATSTDIGTPATTGGSAPTWNVSTGGSTTDGLSTWINFGLPVYDWGPPNAPIQAPTVSIPNVSGVQLKFWQPVTLQQNRIQDNNGYIQTANGSGISGASYPAFKAPPSAAQDVRTSDGTITWFLNLWLNGGGGAGAQRWLGSVTPAFIGAVFGDVCIDSNGNLQCVISGTGATGGGAEPTWSTAYGGTTNDNALVWANCGPYSLLSSQGRKYGYAFHCIDGSVSTMSPLSESTFALTGEGSILGGNYSTNSQVDSVWIFATLSNQPTPLLLASIPNVIAGGTWSFTDQYADNVLNPFFSGPQNGANNPPPTGMTAPIYHLGRIFAIVQNTVVASGGPDTVVGNGNTSFSPSNIFPIPEQPIRLFTGVTAAGPAIFIWATANIWVILGAGTTASPFQKPAKYMGGVGILNYDAVCEVGSTYYAFTTKSKVASLDPGAGYVEFGFPIGDQFTKVTTGGGGKVPFSGAPLGALYSPSSAIVTWAELGSGDTAVYVCDGSVGWFRYSPVASPETGFLWSPRAVLQCGSSAIQAVETSPGNTQLLIGPPAGGSGTGNTTSATLNWVSGPKFNLGWLGQSITINAVVYSIVDVPSPTQIIVNVPIGTLTGINWSIAVTGPILFRDSSVHQDFLPLGIAYQSYPSYDVKGNIVLCQTGEVAEIAHVGLKSVAIGARPSIGLLLGEIAATQTTPFDWLSVSSPDPPILPPSNTLFSDRYSTEQNGICPKCDNFQLAIDYGKQAFADELLTFEIYGAKHGERKQQ